MDLIFKNNKLRKICEDFEIATRAIGLNGAIKLKKRLVELQSSDLEHLLMNHVGGCHALNGDRKDQYAMNLVHPYRLVFKVIQIETAFIIEIVDYH